MFCPAIYRKPQIFMQRAGTTNSDSAEAQPYYNGVVYSEMKGAFSSVDELMETESMRLLFPNNCYGFVSGGHPENIPKLTYEQFIANHRRFYHPSNSRIFLDGKMDIDEILHYIDAEYLSKYDYRAPDFDFLVQQPTAAEKTVSYCVKPRRGRQGPLGLLQGAVPPRRAGKGHCRQGAGKIPDGLQRGPPEAGLPWKRACARTFPCP